MAPRESQVRGPTSALTEFLRERGIRRQNLAAAPPEDAEPNDLVGYNDGRAAVETEVIDALMADAQDLDNARPQTTDSRRQSQQRKRQAARIKAEEDSSDLSDAEEYAAAVAASKVTQVAPGQPEASSSRQIAKKTKKKKAPSDEDLSDDDMDLVAQSKAPRSAHSYKERKAGSIDFCVMCRTKFTITIYTEPYTTEDGVSGALCYKCAKLYGKAAANNGRPKAPAPRKKPVKRGTGRAPAQDLDPKKRVPSLQDLCIRLVGKHIEEVDALGDIGAFNMDKICKIISRNRSLTNETVKLFVEDGALRTDLTLYDATKIDEGGYIHIASMCPNLTRLQINLCGQINDHVIDHFADHLLNLRVLDLDGPFLVTTQCWKRFFERVGPRLEGFCATQSARIDSETIRCLADHCPNLQQLRLSRIGKLTNEGVYHLTELSRLRHLELSWPGSGMGLVSNHSPILDDSIISVIDSVGPNLETLILDGNRSLTDRVLTHSIMPHCGRLRHVSFEECEKLTARGATTLFRGWAGLPQLPRKAGEDLHEAAGQAAAQSSPVQEQASTAPTMTIAASEETKEEATDETSEQGEDDTGAGPSSKPLKKKKVLKKGRNRRFRPTPATLPRVGGSAMEAPTGQAAAQARQVNGMPSDAKERADEAMLPPAAKNEGLHAVNLNRCVAFDDLVLDALLTHSSASLQSLQMHSLDHLSAEAIRRLIGNPIPELPPLSFGESSAALSTDHASQHNPWDSRARVPDNSSAFKTRAELEAEEASPTKPALHGPCSVLRSLDLSWIRSVDDFTLADIIRGCEGLEEIKVWGCSRVTDSFGVKEVSAGRGVRVVGRERDAVFT